MAISPLGSLPSLAGIPQVQPFNPLEALIGGFQQGVALRQLPQQIANDQLNQQLQQALLQAKVNSLPLEAQKQQLALQQLQAQLDPNYAAKQRAAEIDFAVQKARALGQVERELATPQQVPLKFTETDTEIVSQDPFSGVVKSRIQKVPGARYQATPNGVMVFNDPANPTKGTIVPGSEPIVAASGGVKPVFDPANPTQIIGYEVPKNFRAAKDLKTEAPTSSGQEFARESAERNLQSISDLKNRVSNKTVGLGSVISGIPGTGSADFAADLETLKANISFGALQEMRNASKTGGALGQVSNTEGKKLESVLGALDPKQSPENFLKNLNRIEESINKFNKAVQQAPKSATSSQPVRVNTKAERDALAPGTKYIGPDGLPATR